MYSQGISELFGCLLVLQGYKYKYMGFYRVSKQLSALCKTTQVKKLSILTMEGRIYTDNM